MIWRWCCGILSVCYNVSCDPNTRLNNSYQGVMAALLQEIVTVYHLLSPPNLTAHISNRVCNALALLQCVASHQETRQLFLGGKSLFEILHANH